MRNGAAPDRLSSNARRSAHIRYSSLQNSRAVKPCTTADSQTLHPARQKFPQLLEDLCPNLHVGALLTTRATTPVQTGCECPANHTSPSLPLCRCAQLCAAGIVNGQRRLRGFRGLRLIRTLRQPLPAAALLAPATLAGPIPNTCHESPGPAHRTPAWCIPSPRTGGAGGISCLANSAVVNFAVGNFAEVPGFCVVNFAETTRNVVVCGALQAR